MTPAKLGLIASIICQYSSYLPELLLDKRYEVQNIGLLRTLEATRLRVQTLLSPVCRTCGSRAMLNPLFGLGSASIPETSRTLA